MSNISGNYDLRVLVHIQAQVGQYSGYWQAISGSDSVISMQDAIAIADHTKEDFHKRKNLTEDQKALIAVVADERKTQAGRMLTDSAAHRGEYLAAAAPAQSSGPLGEQMGDVTVLDTKSGRSKGDSLTNVLHHELTHSLQQETAKIPDGLSSFDRKLWQLGIEGQAFAAAADENARRHGQTMTDTQRQTEFQEFVVAKFMEGRGVGYQRVDGLEDSTRTDGRQLTVAEFEKAFGFIPGHEKDAKGNPVNFLANGNFKDVADIFINDPQGRPNEKNGYIEYMRELASQKPVKFEDLPVAAPGSGDARFETMDKDLVILVSHPKGSPDAHVSVYKAVHLPGGDAYVKIMNDKPLKTGDIKKIGDTTFYGFSESMDSKKHGFETININVDHRGNVVGMVQYGTSLEEHLGRGHENTAKEINNPRISSPSAPMHSGQKITQNENTPGASGLPDHVLASSRDAADMTRKLMEGAINSTVAQNSSRGNAADKDRGRSA